MNKNHILLPILVLAIFSFLGLSEQILATVGGPTYISQIAYDTSNESVYYIENDYGGKGCPPIVHSVNLAKIKDIEVKTCDEVLKDFFSNYNAPSGENEGKYNQYIADTYQDFSYIGSVSLKKNNIDINVEFLSEHFDESGYTMWSEFRTIITQDNKEVAKLDFRGCTKDQPHIFEGYMIPNSDAMAILISNKGDCFEGGYVRESLEIIRGIKYYDKNIVRSIKEESATEPNTGNMVVYASENAENNDGDTLPASQNNSIGAVILVGIIFIVGLISAYIVGRKA